MPKKSSVSSSRPGKQIRVNAESIWNKPLSEGQKATADKVARRQKRAAASEIDCSDIPALTDKQLAQFRSLSRTALPEIGSSHQLLTRLKPSPRHLSTRCYID